MDSQWTKTHDPSSTIASGMATYVSPYSGLRSSLERELESKLLDLQMYIFDLLIDISYEENHTVEVLLRIKKELKTTFLDYNRVVNSLDREKQLTNATLQERKELQEEFEMWKGKVTDGIHDLNVFMRAAGQKVSNVAEFAINENLIDQQHKPICEDLVGDAMDECHPDPALPVMALSCNPHLAALAPCPKVYIEPKLSALAPCPEVCVELNLTALTHTSVTYSVSTPSTTLLASPHESYTEPSPTVTVRTLPHEACTEPSVTVLAPPRPHETLSEPIVTVLILPHEACTEPSATVLTPTHETCSELSFTVLAPPHETCSKPIDTVIAPPHEGCSEPKCVSLTRPLKPPDPGGEDICTSQTCPPKPLDSVSEPEHVGLAPPPKPPDSCGQMTNAGLSPSMKPLDSWYVANCVGLSSPLKLPDYWCGLKRAGLKFSPRCNTGIVSDPGGCCSANFGVLI